MAFCCRLDSVRWIDFWRFRLWWWSWRKLPILWWPVLPQRTYQFILCQEPKVWAAMLLWGEHWDGPSAFSSRATSPVFDIRCRLQVNLLIFHSLTSCRFWWILHGGSLFQAKRSPLQQCFRLLIYWSTNQWRPGSGFWTTNIPPARRPGSQVCDMLKLCKTGCWINIASVIRLWWEAICFRKQYHWEIKFLELDPCYQKVVNVLNMHKSTYLSLHNSWRYVQELTSQENGWRSLL